jgi:hypothetical protein
MRPAAVPPPLPMAARVPARLDATRLPDLSRRSQPPPRKQAISSRCKIPANTALPRFRASEFPSLPPAFAPRQAEALRISNDLLLASVTPPPPRQSFGERLEEHVDAWVHALQRWPADVLSWFRALRQLARP